MKNVLVIGAARSGLAAARLLAQNGYSVTLTDQNKIPNHEDLEACGIQVFDEGHPEALKEVDYDFIVKNPGIPYHAPFVHWFAEKGTPIYTEIETAFRLAPDFVYGAVTGTDGKTTITTLLYEMLKAQYADAEVAGNIGIPLSETVLKREGAPAHVALELSNFQLLGIDTFRPHISVVSNLAPDHLDYMDSLEDYYRSKFRIYQNETMDDYFIRNLDDSQVVKYAVDIPCQVIDFSLTQKDANLRVEKGSVWLDDLRLFDVRDLKLVGSFNLANAMMAAAMAWHLGVEQPVIEHVIQTFRGVEHRIEYVDTIDGIRIYNDSKATNTHSAEAALSSFEGNIRLLAGGKDKGIDYTVLKPYDERIARCYSFGQIQDVFKEIFSDVQTCHTMEQAFDQALADAKSGDVILLCPATSSFDQFKNYEVRGEIFKELVHERLEAIRQSRKESLPDTSEENRPV